MITEFGAHWALILGGSSGLGLASAKKLAQHGMNICVVHRNAKAEMHDITREFEDIQKSGVKLLAFNADAVNPQKMDVILDAIQDQLGNEKIRCLLHSIAKGNLKAMVGQDEPELQKDDLTITLDNMAVSLYEWVKAIYFRKLFAEDSRVISFTSEGNQKAYQGYAAVSVAKVALEAITRSVALEFAPYGIRANCIQAGVTDTRSQNKIPGSEEMKTHAALKNPFKRITTPKDVADVVYLLCKDEAAWINGAIIPVDGGESISL